MLARISLAQSAPQRQGGSFQRSRVSWYLAWAYYCLKTTGDVWPGKEGWRHVSAAMTRGRGHHVLKLPSKENPRSFCQLCYYGVGLAKAKVKVTRTLLLPVFAWFLSNYYFYSFTYKHSAHWPLSSFTSIPTLFTLSLSYNSLSHAFFYICFVCVMPGLIRTICLTVGLELSIGAWTAQSRLHN